jgi:hypothetical protein
VIAGSGLSNAAARNGHVLSNKQKLKTGLCFQLEIRSKYPLELINLDAEVLFV